MTRQMGLTASSTTSTQRRVARTAIMAASKMAEPPSYTEALEQSAAHEAAYGRLELKNGLQGSLRALGLIGRVGGVELAAP